MNQMELRKIKIDAFVRFFPYSRLFENSGIDFFSFLDEIIDFKYGGLIDDSGTDNTIIE